MFFEDDIEVVIEEAQVLAKKTECDKETIETKMALHGSAFFEKKLSMIFAPENGNITRRKERKLWVTFAVGLNSLDWHK